ncbi:hypothetical protein [Bacillus marinisedimentorum]|nr:hypothetical protein [Bacillus marinisedimentorum]
MRETVIVWRERNGVPRESASTWSLLFVYGEKSRGYGANEQVSGVK